MAIYQGKELREKDVENAFAKYLSRPQQFPSRIVGQQVPLPLGVMDILAVEDDEIAHTIEVVEVKKDKIDLSACGQLLGYMYQVQALLEDMERDRWGNSLEFAMMDVYVPVRGILVGASIDERVYRISRSRLGFSLYTYAVQNDEIIFESAMRDFLLDQNIPPPDSRLQSALEHCSSKRAEYAYGTQTSSLRNKEYEGLYADKTCDYWDEVFPQTVVIWQASEREPRK